jgi:hypothetical protein
MGGVMPTLPHMLYRVHRDILPFILPDFDAIFILYIINTAGEYFAF